jgi:FkbM family methyltransferase
MKLLQIISEYRLCGKSLTLPPAQLRAEYIRLLRQAARADAPRESRPQTMSFFGRPLQCFHQPSVVSFFREIFIYQHYNPPMALGPAPVIIDAGGNIGLFAIYAAMVLPNARLRVFEADPTTCTALRANIATYVGDRAVVVNVALADGAGTIRIVNDGGNPNRSTNTIMRELLAADAPGVSSAEVPMGRLSEQCADLPQIDFLKMDIEGAEFPVFNDLAAAGTLGRVRALAMEVHRRAYECPAWEEGAKHRLSGLLRQLEDAGFALDFFARGSRPFGLERLDDTFILRAFKKP